MRKLIGIVIVVATVAVLVALPAGANPRGSNGRIVFTRFDPALDDDFVYTANPDGSGERQLLPTGAEGPRWSPDGTRIVVGPHDVDNVSARIVNPDDGSYRDLPNPNPELFFLPCNEPWSPDGQRLTCQAFGNDDQSVNGIYTIRASDGGGLERVTRAEPDGEDCAGDYSPNGKRLVFLRANYATGVFALFTIELDGSGLRQITPSSSDQFSIDAPPNCGDWSPQGNEILFSVHAPSDHRATVWAVHSDGSGLRQIPIPECGGLISDPTSIGCFQPSWSPDGRKIVFVRRSVGQNDVYTVNADGAGLSEVSGTPHDEGGPPDWGTHPLLP
jgi:Tol biopolymer transport system component